ncbi:FliH/SctL family protein [Thiovibrio sp. JS02]
MSRVIKLQKDLTVQSAPKLETEEFLSFEDFWQKEAAGEPEAPAEKPRDPREIAEEEAAEIVRQAREQAERIKQDAHDKGFARGEAAGSAAGHEQYRGRIAALDAFLAALEGQRGAVLRQYEEDLLALIRSMVERLVHHEVSVNPLVIQACLKNAMEFVVENSTVQIHLNNEDFNRLKKASLENPRLIEGKNRIQLVEDPNISAGGCLLKTDFGEIDATLENCKEKLYAAVDKAFLAALGDS